MESIAFFFFALRLAFALIGEFVFIVLRLCIGTKTFLLSSFLYFILAGSAMVQFALKTPPPKRQIIFEKDRQAAETRIAFWESLVTTSPNRDAFLNLEQLYRYLNEEDSARLIRKRAYELDPNNEQFKNDAWLWEDEVTASPAATPVTFQ